MWDWVHQVVERFKRQGVAEAALAGSASSLTERLRIDIERERDRLAQNTFNQLVEEGLVQFSLRADATDYELPAFSELTVVMLCLATTGCARS